MVVPVALQPITVEKQVVVQTWVEPVAPHCTLQSLAVLVAEGAQEPLEIEELEGLELVVLALTEFGEGVAEGESNSVVLLGFELVVSGSSSLGLSSSGGALQSPLTVMPKTLIQGK